MALTKQVEGAVKSITALAADMKRAFIERDNEVDILLTALVSGQNCCLLGPPGTGKSNLINVMCNAIGGTSFQYLVTKYTSPEEILGNWDYKEMTTTGKMVRRTKGKLPEAKVAFLDEVFKGNSAFLNSLLTVLQERAFDDDNGRQQVKTEMVVGASNELPNNGLDALWDRFTMRCWVEQISTDNGYDRLLYDNTVGVTNAKVTQKQVQTVRNYVSKNYKAITKNLSKRFADLRYEMQKQQMTMSGRRWVKAQQIVAGAAVLDGTDIAEPKHFSILKNVIWNKKSQIATASAVINEVSCGPEKQSLKILEAFYNTVDDLHTWFDYTQVTQNLENMRRSLQEEAATSLGGDDKYVKEANKYVLNWMGALLKQCGNEPSLEAVMKEAATIKSIADWCNQRGDFEGKQDLINLAQEAHTRIAAAMQKSI